nr:hypothetical protein JVH1_0322 [Rhodococcus sp. JVH1]
MGIGRQIEHTTVIAPPPRLGVVYRRRSAGKADGYPNEIVIGDSRLHSRLLDRLPELL